MEFGNNMQQSHCKKWMVCLICHPHILCVLILMKMGYSFPVDDKFEYDSWKKPSKGQLDLNTVLLIWRLWMLRHSYCIDRTFFNLPCEKCEQIVSLPPSDSHQAIRDYMLVSTLCLRSCDCGLCNSDLVHCMDSSGGSEGKSGSKPDSWCWEPIRSNWAKH